MVYKCKVCGGSLMIKPKSRIATCEFCGIKQVLPLFDDDASQQLYDRGNSYLANNEYDKAEAIFVQLLSIDSNDPEIYWNLVLCKYGVTYVKDPKTHKYIPTCNRTYYGSIFKDENYLKAIERSEGEEREQYQAEAKVIDEIQKGIIAVSKKEKPYDIFISFKDTDDEGNRTQDSIEAQKLYNILTELGYKVFYSRITLESKVGQEYEPYIYAALSSSKVMILVASSRKYIEAPWVKNEWSRFLTLRRNNPEKTLIPVYYGMDKEELPDDFSLLPMQNMREEGFEDELTRGIKKIIPLSVTKAERRRAIVKTAIILLLTTIVVGGTYTAFAYSKYRKEKAQKEISDALTAKYQEALGLYNKENYTDAKTLFTELGKYEDAETLAYNCDYMPAYNQAMDLYYNRNYPEAAWAFRDMNDFLDSGDMQEKCERAWREKLSTVAIEPELSGSSWGAYYITANGTVDNFDSAPGGLAIAYDLNEKGEIIGKHDFEVNEHGKVVSIQNSAPNTSGGTLYALYEDGYVYNSAYLNGMEDDWTNVIQITEGFDCTNVALIADGTVAIGKTEATAYYDDIPNGINYDDRWLEEVTSWEDIIQLDSCIGRLGSGDTEYAIITGLSCDGKVHVVSKILDETNGNNDSYHEDNSLSWISSIQDIKEIRLKYGYDSSNNLGLFLAALDNKNILHIYNDRGEETTIERSDLVDFYFSSDGFASLYVLNNKGELLKNETVLMDDVVYVCNKYVIKNSGSIYKIDGSATNSKTSVKSVWMEK